VGIHRQGIPGEGVGTHRQGIPGEGVGIPGQGVGTHRQGIPGEGVGIPGEGVGIPGTVFVLCSRPPRPQNRSLHTKKLQARSLQRNNEFLTFYFFIVPFIAFVKFYSKRVLSIQELAGF
jgi:hypothetical protein